MVSFRNRGTAGVLRAGSQISAVRYGMGYGAMSKAKQLKFKRLKVQSFTIVDDLKKEVGRIRVEPDAVSWRPAGVAHWYRLGLKDFENLAVQHGTKGKEAG